MYNKKNFLT